MTENKIKFVDYCDEQAPEDVDLTNIFDEKIINFGLKCDKNHD